MQHQQNDDAQRRRAEEELQRLNDFKKLLIDQRDLLATQLTELLNQKDALQTRKNELEDQIRQVSRLILRLRF